RIRPRGVLGHTVASPDGPVAGLSLPRAVRAVVRGLQEVHPDLVLGEVVDRQVTVLVQQLGVPAVHDRLPAENPAHPARRVLEVDDAVGARALEVEDAGRVMAERAGTGRQAHGSMVAPTRERVGATFTT